MLHTVKCKHRKVTISRNSASDNYGTQCNNKCLMWHGLESDYIHGKSSVYQHACIERLANNLQRHAQPLWGRSRTSLHCGREPKGPEGSRTATGRTRKPTTFLLVRRQCEPLHQASDTYFMHLLIVSFTFCVSFIVKHCAVYQISFFSLFILFYF